MGLHSTLRIFRTSATIFAKMHMLSFIYMTKVAWCFGAFWGYWDSKRKYGEAMSELVQFVVIGVANGVQLLLY